jgi:hypothetical protein
MRYTFKKKYHTNTKVKASNTVKRGEKGEGKIKNECALASLKFFSLGNSLLSAVEVEETASKTTSINTINLQRNSNLWTYDLYGPGHNAFHSGKSNTRAWPLPHLVK